MHPREDGWSERRKKVTSYIYWARRFTFCGEEMLRWANADCILAKLVRSGRDPWDGWLAAGANLSRRPAGRGRHGPFSPGQFHQVVRSRRPAKFLFHFLQATQQELSEVHMRLQHRKRRLRHMGPATVLFLAGFTAQTSSHGLPVCFVFVTAQPTHLRLPRQATP